MPTVWFSLKRSLHCKSSASDVHDPKMRKQSGTILTKRSSSLSSAGGTGRSGCSRSIANLKDVVIHGHNGSKRHHHFDNNNKPPSSAASPRSIGSSEFLNPITHEVILSNSTCELKITNAATGGSTFVDTLRPGTPGPGGHNPTMHYFNPSFRTCPTPPRKSSHKEGSEGRVHRPLETDCSNNNNVSSNVMTCHKCGEQFNKWDAAEAHHLSKHAVTELVEGDSSRKIVEIICRTSWIKSENHCGQIERVLKVHNMQRTLARFEEYRETVKNKASKLQKKHPRCIADGNELLRFYGTTVSCSLGLNGSSSLCLSEKCCVCRIIRNGFNAKTELKGGVGVFTTSTSGTAFESIEISSGDDEKTSLSSPPRKALIVCRVIAGRVHRPLENIQEIAAQTGFDSLAGKIGLYSNIEELFLLNPRALLPCFVVICKP